jgi:hypothetical protein
VSFKEGDIVVVLEDEISHISGVIFLKAGEVCKIVAFSSVKKWIALQSLNPSYGAGRWNTRISNIEFAPEMLRVLS